MQYPLKELATEAYQSLKSDMNQTGSIHQIHLHRIASSLGKRVILDFHPCEAGVPGPCKWFLSQAEPMVESCSIKSVSVTLFSLLKSGLFYGAILFYGLITFFIIWMVLVNTIQCFQKQIAPPLPNMLRCEELFAALEREINSGSDVRDRRYKKAWADQKFQDLCVNGCTKAAKDEEKVPLVQLARATDEKFRGEEAGEGERLSFFRALGLRLWDFAMWSEAGGPDICHTRR
jgi:hypothetical protein